MAPKEVAKTHTKFNMSQPEEAKVPKEEMEFLKNQKQGYKCLYCNVPLKEDELFKHYQKHRDES